MLNGLKRIVCLLLVIAMPAAFCADAFATIGYREADAPEYYVNTYCLKVYDKPSLKSKVRETVPYAKNLKVVAVKKGWAKVYTVNRVLGYCQSSLLVKANPNTLNMKIYCQQSEVNVYQRPDINSPILGHLYHNEATRVVAMTPLGDWLRIEQGDSHGYVQRPRMDSKRYTAGRPAWCIDESMTVYYDYRLDTQLATLYFGEQFSLLEKRGSWAKIRSSSNLIGFCHVSAISTTNPNDINATVYTQADGNFMFKSSTDLSGRVQVDKDEKMTLMAVDKNRFWARVYYQDSYYYIPYIFLGTEKRGKSYKKVESIAGLNIRVGTKNSSAIVATVPKGTQMWLIDAMDNRVKVTTLPDYNGRSYTGFAELQYLK